VRFTRAPAGNLETLNEIPKKLGIDIRAELLKFHAEKYSSNIMKLAVFGRGECSLFLLNESKASSQSCTSCRLVFFFFFIDLLKLFAEDLDTLQRWVAEKFSAVKNLQLKKPAWPGRPFCPENHQASTHLFFFFFVIRCHGSHC
jgi:insulysin